MNWSCPRSGERRSLRTARISFSTSDPMSRSRRSGSMAVTPPTDPLGKLAPSTERSLTSDRSSGSSASSRAARSAVSVAGHLEPVHFADQVVAATARLDQIAVDQAADRLDRVEGHPVGADSRFG